jgi:DNA-binding transcriptional ArsR family regulator
MYFHYIFSSMNISTLIALAEPNRLRIVELLAESPPSTVGRIAEQLNIRQPQVSKHLQVLSQAGIVRVSPNARQRICELNVKPLEDLEVWIESFIGRSEPRQAGLLDAPERHPAVAPRAATAAVTAAVTAAMTAMEED